MLYEECKTPFIQIWKKKTFLWEVQGLELTFAFEICMIYYSLNREVAHPGNCCKQTQKNKTKPLVFKKW